jgi:NADPH:quinone reductase-like Zn-dependent oxidoreductase
LNISRKEDNPTPVLVWGGSCKLPRPIHCIVKAYDFVASVGAFAIQLARAYSIPVVTVCSPRNFDLCKSLGATHVFDYNDEDVVEKIQSVAPNIAHVFDCIGSQSSSTIASKAVVETGGVLCSVRPGKQFTDNVESRVEVVDVLVWTVFLKDHTYKQFTWPVSSKIQVRCL